MSSDNPREGGAPPRRAVETFHARRRGAVEAPGPPPEVEPPPEEVSEYEAVELPSDESGSPTDRAERTRQLQRFQRELDQTPICQHLRLRIDYADNGVSRIHLPAESGDTEPGPLEGGVVGAICVAAGHVATASIVAGLGIRLVEYKVNILGVVQGNLLAIGEVVRKGRTLVACRIEVVEDNDRVVALALVTYLLQQS